jgi:hypothetical protein
MTMNPDTLAALRGSIQKWQSIVAGTGTDQGLSAASAGTGASGVPTVQWGLGGGWMKRARWSRIESMAWRSS